MLLLELERRQVVRAAVRPDGLKRRRQVLMTTFASARERKHSTLRHSSRRLPLKLSSLAFCQTHSARLITRNINP